MKPQPMVRKGDCLATCCAALLNIDATDLPWTGADDHEHAWRLLRTALWERGWRITWQEWTEEGQDDHTLADLLAYNGDEGSDGYDTIDSSMLWMVSVGHPSFVEDGDEVGHVIVIERGRVVFDPTFSDETRPPHSELVMRGSFMFSPIDPGRFLLEPRR